MPNLPISGLTASASNAAATDVLPVVQTTGAGPVKMTVQQMAGGLLGSTTLSGATITADAPVLNMSQTWNNGAVTFTGLKFNAAGTSDANSASASLLMDLQVNTASKFNIRKDGYITMADSTIAWGATGLTLTRGSGINMLIGSTTSVGQNGISLGNGTGIAYTASASPSTSQDLFLTRRAAANLRLGAADAAAPVAQTLSVQSVVAGTSNTAGANLTITGSQGTGTGAGGSIIFQVAPAGSSGTAQNALAEKMRIDASGQVVFNNNTGRVIDQFSNIVWGFNQITGTTLRANVLEVGNASDTILTRDAANTLALRNGTNAQTFNIYNTYTDASNYERLAFVSGAAFEIQAQAAGSGSGKSIQIKGGSGAGFFFGGGGAVQWQVNSSGNLLAQTDNTYDIGASGANRPRRMFAAGYITAPEVLTGNIKTAGGSGGLEFSSTTLATLTQTTFAIGGTSSSFPALKRSTTFLQVVLANDTGFAGFASANMQAATAYTVATLPGTPGTGMIARVTDASAPVIGTTVAGGGAAYALVNYNGANWTVIGV